MNPATNKRIRLSIIIGSSFFVFFFVLGVLRNKYGPKQKQQSDDPAISITVHGKQKIADPFPAEWQYKTGDNKFWAVKDLQDNDWKKISPQLNVNDKNFTGIAWFRCRFRIPPVLVNNVFALKLDHLGASEIYYDGKLVEGFGKVSADPRFEIAERPLWPILLSAGDTLQHTLAIRYSNHAYLNNLERYGEKHPGITLTFMPNGSASYGEIEGTETILFWFVLLFGFFITLSLVHFLIYIFYRRLIENLYYSIFVFGFALLALSPCLLLRLTAPSAWLFFQQNMIFVVVLFFLSIVACLHTLFKPNLAKRMLIIEAALGVSVLIVHFSSIDGLEATLISALVLFALIESSRTVIVGMRKKYPGAAIIGSGVLMFFLFVGILFVDAFITQNIGFSQDTSLYVVVLAFISIISIPLSMSIYLARNFAKTNTNLEAKLLEVESLSAKTIEQEKEKQYILENQNIVLEQQVIERTHEINEQKKIIEEKNKDIIDSINYAKRIQVSLLPTEKYIERVLRRNKPKDH
jgi:hypothetical protein